MQKIIKTFDSSDKKRSYAIVETENGLWYCTCPAWKFSAKKNDGVHDCKHLQEARKESA